MQYYPDAAHGFSYAPDTPANIAVRRESGHRSIAFLDRRLLPDRRERQMAST